MAPPGVLLDPIRDNISISSDTDSENDAPVVKIKIPLNKQYQALETHQQSRPRGADIDWIPSWQNYMQRVNRRLKEGAHRATSLPQGFPSSFSCASNWSGNEISVSELIHVLSETQIGEIEQALAHLKEFNILKDDICPETFPLPTLKADLEAIAQKVHKGHGIAILRGLNPAQYSFEDNVLIYAGVASYIGATRGTQDNSGNVLVHIKNVGASVAPDDQRQSPYANNAQPFHNDLGDIIAMYCVDRAMVGGVSRIASAAKVYNELASTRPDLVTELSMDKWVFDRHDETRSFYQRPILFHDPVEKHIFFCFSRRQLTGSTVSPRPEHFPPLTEAQAEALDAVHFTADKHALNLQLEKGDVQFSNNLALFHAREAFQDGEDSNRRHLIRMWLRNEDLAWTTPPDLRAPWEEIYGGMREPVWHMSPEHGTAHVINSRTSCHG